MIRSTGPARRVTAALGSLLLAGCQAAPAIPAPAPPSSTSGSQQPTATPDTAAATAPGLTPQQRLTTIATTLHPVPADNTTHLPITYLHLQTWTRATTVIRREDLQRWRHPDGSGREVSRRAADVRDVDHQPTPGERHLFLDAPPTTTRYRGDLHPYLPEPLPTDPSTLAELLAPPELATEPAYPRILTGAVIALAASQYLNQQQRTTTLHVLATVPGIDYLGTTTDLAGRTGLAFQVIADTSTTTLIINPATGELLAAQERITGPRLGLFSHVLILRRGHTSTDGVPPEPA
ncbi:hypothetical protein [Micromonospora sp. WMMD1082]|uniref:hypothetical protein n=1 Tax=Micromonospora sp. WMMD1082 TaxID=3016104 RepID=UPI0024177189|nr:hypothetical protein [Micromonospora sp. WMMD1082]MDG4796924.1 hypothetical protein [Micromonospora sp. WMMD1082]